jgi:phosphohistidine swiveling domain-containing protein
VAGLAGAAAIGGLVLAMTPAHAEASATTTTLTLTGMVSSTCDLGTGGTVAYVAPGGTMTIKASLAGASVQVPVVGTVALDSSLVASFVDEVTIDGKQHTLRSTSDTIVLRNVTGTHKISWQATGVSLLGGIGTVPLNASNVVGGELDWSGTIVASKNTDCGIAVSVPTTKLHVGTHTVTVPGINASLPNPIPKLLPTAKASSPSVAPPHRPSGGAVNYTPPGVSVPQQVMPHAINYGGVGGADGTGHAAAARGGAASAGGSASAHTSPTPSASPAAKVRAGAEPELSQPDQPVGLRRPILLALAAILALFTVSAMWARTHLPHLLRHPR